MSRTVNVALSYEALETFLEIAKRCEESLSNAGCNDFEWPDSPEARELYDQVEADNCGLELGEYRQSEEYHEPPVTDRTIYFADFALFGYVTERMAEQLRAA